MNKTMQTDVIHEGINRNGKKYKVVAFYGNMGFLYTKTYIYDEDGFVDMTITVYTDGQVDIK